MRRELLDELMVISEEEKHILDGEVQVQRDLYTSNANFVIDSEKLLKKGRYITVRPHTRFVDFPPHTHEYIEMMYVCQGKITHDIDGKELCLQAGDLLLMNQHVTHGIRKAEAEDIGINFIVLPEFFDIPLSMLRKDNVLADFLINGFRRDVVNPQYLHFQTRGMKSIDNLMENIVDSLFHEEEKDDNINQISMGVIFLYLLNHMDTIEKNSSQNYRDILIHTTLQYINEHYREASLTDLAADLHQSVSALSRLIKRATGYTYQELLQRK